MSNFGFLPLLRIAFDGTDIVFRAGELYCPLYVKNDLRIVRCYSNIDYNGIAVNALVPDAYSVQLS